KSFSGVEVIQNKVNGGFAAGYNEALKKVKAEYFILLNSDIETPENWTFPLIDFMKKNQDVAACQPKILDYSNKTMFEYAGASGGFMDKYGYPFCRGRIFNFLEEDKGQYNTATEVFWATGACMVIRSDVFFKVGGFDADYFAHMEEIDLCWRMKNLGYKIFVIPDSHIYHVGGGTLNKVNPHKTFLNFRNNLITYTKNHSGKLLLFLIIFRIKLDAVAAIKFLLEGNLSHAFAVVKAHWAYLFSLGKTLSKRKAQKNQKGYSPTRSGIFNGNIVFLHFIKKLKKFSELDPGKFF
ncbi:MAG: glycosyltransferase family 2 protein, partial [Bacteroidia bacterium]|nr:glycosyltransferase family 2 protein [Bacteroidia bacterium]